MHAQHVQPDEVRAKSVDSEDVAKQALSKILFKLSREPVVRDGCFCGCGVFFPGKSVGRRRHWHR